MPHKRFRKLALGGTFDVLHAGHEKTITEAFKIAERVLIGLTTDSLAGTLGKKYKVNPYGKREESLKKFLQAKGLLVNAEIIPITTSYGVAHEVEDLDAIMVSEEKYSVALGVNEARRRRGLKELEIVTFRKIPSENGKPISSTRIRLGEITREGYLPNKS